MSGTTDIPEPVPGLSFDSSAEAYELGRPAYPGDALDWWRDRRAIEPGNVVLDLAAGTGKLTRLVPVACERHAVEPLAEMRAICAVSVPGATIVDGTAEAIPYPDDTFDTVLVGQAFHWFDPPQALVEIARVLKPGGGLGLIWNDDDTEGAGWVASLVAAKRRVGGGSPIATARDSPRVLELDPHLHDVESIELRWSEPTGPERVVASVQSRSYVNLLGDEERAELLACVNVVVEPLGAEFEHPYVTFVTWTRTAP